MIRLDLASFSKDGIISESSFFDRLRQFNWEPYRQKAVLVGSCGLKAVPAWVYMAISARLSEVARMIRFGNEHSNIIVYKREMPVSDSDENTTGIKISSKD